MDRTIAATVNASPDKVMAALSDLGTYPHWLDIVSAAELAAGTVTGPDPAWLVTLRARLGPLARSKRLRMVRTALDATSVRFERAELDGRSHSDWTLDATLDERPTGNCDVEVHLHYGGSLWVAALEPLLASVEGGAADRLAAYLDAAGRSDEGRSHEGRGDTGRA